MDAAEKGEVIYTSGKSREKGMNFMWHVVVLQVEEVTRLLNSGELVDVGDLWTGKVKFGPL